MLICLLNFFIFTLSLIGFRGLHFLAVFLGFICFDILRIKRRIILNNIDLVFQESKSSQEKKTMGRQSTIALIETILEFICSKYIYKKANYLFKNLENTEKIKQLLQNNVGFYAVCIHMSNWEFLCYAINKSYYKKTHVVVKQLAKGKLGEWIKNTRDKNGMVVLERSQSNSATKKIFSAIHNGNVIGFIVDQKRPKGEHIAFFGKQASTNNSLAKLYLRTPAPIIPAFIQRAFPGCYEIVILPEYKPKINSTSSLAQKVTQITLEINQIVEQMILAHPQEYLWMHNRWNI